MSTPWCDPEREAAEAAIMALLAERPAIPIADLWDWAKRHRIDEEAARMAFWNLIDRRRLHLSDDWRYVSALAGGGRQ
jgi:hypothetical protein